jgi:hypothetical protein
MKIRRGKRNIASMFRPVWTDTVKALILSPAHEVSGASSVSRTHCRPAELALLGPHHARCSCPGFHFFDQWTGYDWRKDVAQFISRLRGEAIIKPRSVVGIHLVVFKVIIGAISPFPKIIQPSTYVPNLFVQAVDQ